MWRVRREEGVCRYREGVRAVPGTTRSVLDPRDCARTVIAEASSCHRLLGLNPTRATAEQRLWRLMTYHDESLRLPSSQFPIPFLPLLLSRFPCCPSVSLNLLPYLQPLVGGGSYRHSHPNPNLVISLFLPPRRSVLVRLK